MTNHCHNLSKKESRDLNLTKARQQGGTGVQPPNAATHTKHGLALEQNGDLIGAIKAHKLAVLWAPNHAEAHFHLACAFSKSGDARNAIQEYKQVIELDRNNWLVNIAEAASKS